MAIPCEPVLSAAESRGGSILDGMLNILKPDGWTSHDVVKRMRAALAIQKVGHAGTLDPHATGVLPVLIGKGTRIAQHLVQWDKEYVAVLRLGKRTDTQDAWGTVVQETPTRGLSDERVREALKQFQGTVQQVPPMFSAVKIGGQPLYKKARRGEIVERLPKAVTIYDLEILRIEIPEVTFRVVCSKGTYVRTLCADIGEALQVGGHLQWLQRTRVGPLRLEEAISLESLKTKSDLVHYPRGIWALDRALEHFPAVEVQGDDARKVLHGNAIPWGRVLERTETDVQAPTGGQPIRVKAGDGRLLALGIRPVPSFGAKTSWLKIDTVLV